MVTGVSNIFLGGKKLDSFAVTDIFLGGKKLDIFVVIDIFWAGKNLTVLRAGKNCQFFRRRRGQQNKSFADFFLIETDQSLERKMTLHRLHVRDEVEYYLESDLDEGVKDDELTFVSDYIGEYDDEYRPPLLLDTD